MWKSRWWLALPLALTGLLSLGTSQSQAGTVHDNAGMFSREAVAKANAELSKIERNLKLDVNIETIPSLDGEQISEVALRHAKRSGSSGLFVLLAKDDSKIWTLPSIAYEKTLAGREDTIRRAFTSEFKKQDFDGGLLSGVAAIGSEASKARAEYGSLEQAPPHGNRNVARAGGVPVRRARGGFGLGSLIWIGILVLGVMFVVRMIGALFGAGRSQQGYGPQGRMGGPGYGPGYGGGGGGGFMSGLLGGLGGAVAGNWLYDQFSGRHGGNYSDTTGSDAGAGTDTSPSEGWGADAGGGGSWGGGDAGGGGDWGGGGGGDWGGGGGGGDW